MSRTADSVKDTIKDILDVPPADPKTRWSRVNAAEQFPGVVSTFTWDVWRRTVNPAGRRIFHEMGILTSAELSCAPLESEFFVSVRHGRQVANVDAMRRFIDRFPGNAGDDFEEQILGERPQPGTAPRARKHVLTVLRKLPAAFFTSRRRQARMAEEVDAWYRGWIARIEADPASAPAAIRDLVERLPEIQLRMGLVAFVQQALGSMLRSAIPQSAHPLLLQRGSGSGLPEARFAEAIWRAANDECTPAEVIAEFGHFGVDVADCAKPSLRHDPALLDSMMTLYRDRERPSARLERSMTRTAKTDGEILASIGPLRRGIIRRLLRAYDRMAEARESGRSTWVQALDVGRAAAQALGKGLTASGALSRPDDAYHLTIDELLSPAERDLDAAAAYRKALQDWRESFDLPNAFTGDPQLLRKQHQVEAAAATDAPIRGVGGSAGRARGRARIIRDPFRIAAFDAGDIVVCPITDPSWSPLLALAGGVITDIGGVLSHGAIIARELGVPAVLNTRNGTIRIPDGAMVEMDGTTGEIEILQ